MINIIYIGGYGRSGSTVLDLILGENSEVISTGEICNFLSLTANHDNNLCSCGKSFSKCEFWSKMDLFDRIEPSLKNIGPIFDSNFITLCNEKRKMKSKYFYSIFWKNFFLNLSSDNNCNFIVDSSKTAYCQALRPYFLSNMSESINIHYIHMYKPLGSAITSFKKGTNKGIKNKSKKRVFNVTRSIIGWIFANIVSMAYVKFGKFSSITKVNYSCLIKNTEICLKEISENIGFNLDIKHDVLSGRKPIKDHHIVSGNRMAHGPIYIKLKKPVFK
jgi:hypothetical protein